MAVELTMADGCATARRAWLAASAALAAHTDDCLSCLVEWLPGCDEGHALHTAVDAAWDRYTDEALP